jgi:hypothetical protein
MSDKDEEYSNLNEKLHILMKNVDSLASNLEQVAEINTATVKVSTILNNIIQHTQKYNLSDGRGER